MLIRERTEMLEIQILSPYAALSKNATRQRQEERCPIRTEFQRDRDRIIHSKSFRRLKRKTQVYISPGDHYRTRMTHTLEVGQISRTVAVGLRLNENLAEAIAMGHDVGHTPFGHVGEFALQDILGHFHHNEQSLRVVDYLEKNGAGLNLTNEVRDGIVHHTGEKKPKTLEGQIVRICDRIAYLCHDFDDAERAGMLTVDSLPITVRTVLGETHSQMIATMVADLIINSEGRCEICQSPSIAAAMDEFRRFMFSSVYRAESLAPDRYKAAHIVKNLYAYYLVHTELLDGVCGLGEAALQQAVVDYIAGLTDIYAIKKFKEFYIPNVWEN